MRIFLIAGKAGSGKNEVAKLIKEYYTYRRERTAITSFSKYIKNFALELTDWDGNDINKPRDFMQQLGDNMRKIDPNFLISNMLKDIIVYQNYVDNLVISDVRMPKEIDELKNAFPKSFAIYVVNQFGTSNLTIAQQSHITEIALENYNDFDFIIANDDFNALKNKVFNVLDRIGNNGK